MQRFTDDWPVQDLMFVVRTLVPERTDHARLASLLQHDTQLLDAMLQDDGLFRNLMRDDASVLLVSPRLLFKVLLVRARRDMENQLYTVEMRHLQKLVLLDAKQVVELLGQPDICDYLAAMLAAFTRVVSRTVPVRLRDGSWHQIRVNDLDVDSVLRYVAFVDEQQRFPVYRRLADACLFLTGIFPEYISTRPLHQGGTCQRMRLRSSLIHDLADHENYGRTFYGLAARHPDAGPVGLAGLLGRLSEHFELARKPLVYLSERYLSLRKHRLFAL